MFAFDMEGILKSSQPLVINGRIKCFGSDAGRLIPN